MYALKITDFSSKSLKTIFTKHIDLTAKVTTDLWRGYSPISDEYNIQQIASNKGLNFPALHTMIHQLKSWIRTTYSWVSEFNINRYYDEFCFRINRSQNKKTIFHRLINRMVKHEKIPLDQFICR
jgi:rRNA maturation endonuclease Nob1